MKAQTYVHTTVNSALEAYITGPSIIIENIENADIDITDSIQDIKTHLSKIEEQLSGGSSDSNSFSYTTIAEVLRPFKRTNKLVHTLLDRILEENPEDLNALYQKGETLASAERYDEAIDFFDRALAVDPNRMAVLQSKSRTLRSMGLRDKANGLLDSAMAMLSESKQDLQIKMFFQSDKGDYTEMIVTCRQILSMEEDDLDATRCMGRGYKNLGKVKEATKCYERILEIDPGDWFALKNTGLFLRDAGRHEEALEVYKRASALDSNFPTEKSGVLIAIGDCMFRMDRFEEALTYFTEALELSPDSYYAALNKGIVLYKKGDYLKAYCNFDRASDTEETLQINYLKGIILSTLGATNSAKQFFKKAVEYTASDDLGSSYLGRSHESLGNLKEALKFYKQAKKQGLDDDHTNNHISALKKQLKEKKLGKNKGGKKQNS